MPSRLELALLLSTLPLAACKEPPSFRVRWGLVDRDGSELDVTRAIDCSSLGVNAVQVTAIDGFGDIADERIFPCFLDRFVDLDGDVGGPALPAGPYAIEVRAVQRNGEPWRTGEPDPQIRDSDLTSERSYCHPAAEHVGCQDVDVACSCEVIDVSDAVTPKLRACRGAKDGGHCQDLAALVAPVECVDGIDNDHDGLVDAQDPACSIGDAAAAESASVTIVQFRASVTVLGNESITCADVGLTDLRARACPQQSEPAPCTAEDGTTAAGTIELATIACRDGEPLFFDSKLDKNDYTVELTGLGGSQVLTRPQLAPPVVVLENQPGLFVEIDVDFGVDDFVTPVHAPAEFLIEYEQGPELSSTRACAPDVSAGYGTLAIADVSLELRDAHGGPLSGAMQAANLPVPLDGTPSGCLNKYVRTEPLDWGGYTLRVEARAADGTVCFTTDGQAGAPDAPLTLIPSKVSLVVPRVLIGGVPPDACRDCAVDGTVVDDCNDGMCTNGICQR